MSGNPCEGIVSLGQSLADLIHCLGDFIGCMARHVFFQRRAKDFAPRSPGAPRQPFHPCKKLVGN